MIDVECLNCKVQFKTWPYKLRQGTGKFCSTSCASLSRPAWNKGLKRWWASPTEFKKGDFTNEKHPLWKGAVVGYGALHTWVTRKLGKPLKCSQCGTTEKKYYDWANLSGSYTRDLNDWIRLCRSCHRKMDYRRLREAVTV